MLQIYMCEDDEMQLQYFTRKLKEYLRDSRRDTEVVAGVRNPEELLQLAENIEGNASLLFFLDIQLEGCAMDGFALANALKTRFPECYLVFLTSKSELAYEVFEFQIKIVDYIVKHPEYFLSENLHQGLKRRWDCIFDSIEEQEKMKQLPRIVVECGSRVVELLTEEILYIQSVKTEHQVEICTEHQRLNARMSLKYLAEKLGSGFLYVNKSCIVRKDKIKEVDRKNRYVKLENDFQIEVSYREMKNVLDMFQNG